LRQGEQRVECDRRPLVIVFESVAREIRDGDHQELVPSAEPHEIRRASHGAVVVQDLADHAGGVQSREARKIDCRLSLTATLEDTNGGRSTGSTVVAVQASAPLVTLTASSPVAVNAIVTFSVTVTQNPGNVPVQAVSFNFGDGQVREVQGLSTTYSYSSPNTYVAIATVRFTNGRTATNSAQVRVN